MLTEDFCVIPVPPGKDRDSNLTAASIRNLSDPLYTTVQSLDAIEPEELIA
jgi:hypothetical protein